MATEETPTTTPVPDNQELIKSRDAEFQAKLKAEQELAETKKKLSEFQQAQQKRERIDKDALLKSWQEKCEKLQSELKTRDENLLKGRMDSLISELAVKVNSDVPELFKPLIKERIRGELGEDGRVKLHCVDANGAPIAQTPDELVKEILANDKYKRYVIVNRSSGGSKEPEVKSNVAQFPTPDLSRTDTNDLSKMGNAQLTEYLKQHFVRKEA